MVHHFSGGVAILSMDSFHFDYQLDVLLFFFHLLVRFLQFLLQLRYFGTLDDVLLHSHFATEAFVANLANVLRLIVVGRVGLHITRLALSDMLTAIREIAKVTVTIWTLVLLDTQVTVHMSLVLILFGETESKWRIKAMLAVVIYSIFCKIFTEILKIKSSICTFNEEFSFHEKSTSKDVLGEKPRATYLADKTL